MRLGHNFTKVTALLTSVQGQARLKYALDRRLAGKASRALERAVAAAAAEGAARVVGRHRELGATSPAQDADQDRDYAVAANFIQFFVAQFAPLHGRQGGTMSAE
jgi:hypothetical protein